MDPNVTRMIQEVVGRSVFSAKPTRVRWLGNRILSVDTLDEPSRDGLPWIAPGMLDLQINGFAGVNYGDPNLTLEAFDQVARRLLAIGVTGWLPTLITDSVDRMAQAVARIDACCQQSSFGSAILGIHLEGPYLSSEDGPRGAHPLEHCKDPNWDEFCRLQKASGGRVRLMTLAPERAGAEAFIRRAVDAGVRIALGHTAANRQQILSAVDAGASLATHLGNAAHDRVQRHHNYIYDQLGEDRLFASLIVDGHHLPPHLVKIFLRAKGVERSILVSDAVQYAGLPPGVYDGGYRKFEVRADGFIGVLGEPRLAGSGLLLLRGVENLTRFANASLADAFHTVTSNPARFMGLEAQLGTLAVGADASFTLLDWQPTTAQLVVRKTIFAGDEVSLSAANDP